jgi:hypothetical protein
MIPIIGELQINVQRDEFQDRLDFFYERYLDVFPSSIVSDKMMIGNIEQNMIGGHYDGK